MKNINLTTDFILSKLPDSLCVDVDDVAIIISQTNEKMSYFLIELALQTLNIPYVDNEYIDINSNCENHFELKFFDIESVKEDCPNFFEKIKEIKFNKSKK